MRLLDIAIEIIKKADEDYESAYYIVRAKEHFKHAISILVIAKESVFTPADFSILDIVEKLELGINCCYPYDIKNFPPKLNDAKTVLYVHDVYHSAKNPHDILNIKLLNENDDFNNILNNPMTKFNNTMFVKLFQNIILVYPFFENCYIRYIIQPDYHSNFWDIDLNTYFSLPFMNTAIDMAVQSFKNEITLADFSA